MAALRLGLAFAQPYTIKLMSMVKYPYNINESTQRLALKALEKPIDKEVAEIVAQRIRLVHKFMKFTCIRRIFPSEANFILVKVDNADALYAHLIADGIIVRNRTKVPGCKDCLRITVGLPEENDKLLKSLKVYEEKSHIRR
jgi:histidinol-phosphate aminotransferase